MALEPSQVPTEEVDTAYHFSDTEMTYKGVELRATTIDIIRSHDRVVHQHLDVPGADVEITGRKGYVVDAEIAFFGINWKERLSNAMWLFDTEAETEGELVIPDSLVFDAKWVDAQESWSGKNGKIVRCQFIEHTHNTTNQTMDLSPLSMARQSIPDDDLSTLTPYLDDYESALDAGIAISQDALLIVLYSLDFAAYTIQSTIVLNSQDAIDRLISLDSVRANSIRACPYPYVSVR